MLDYVILFLALISAIVTLILHWREKPPEFKCHAEPEATQTQPKPSPLGSPKVWSGLLAFILFALNWQVNIQATLQKEEQKIAELKRAVRAVYTFKSIDIVADYTLADKAVIATLLPAELLERIKAAGVKPLQFEYGGWNVSYQPNAIISEVVLAPTGDSNTLNKSPLVHLERLIASDGSLTLWTSPKEARSVDPQLQPSLGSDGLTQTIVEVRVQIRGSAQSLLVKSGSVKVRYQASFVPIHPRAPFSTVDAETFYCSLDLEYDKDDPLQKEIYAKRTQERGIFDCQLGDFLVDAKHNDSKYYSTGAVNLEINTFYVLNRH
ncbi:MAG: hypothetical protein KF784_00380 [Fimbriimonadaceae bacterium]|nr:hypothetical protein [Fimbriimonadaceae bacterium]